MRQKQEEEQRELSDTTLLQLASEIGCLLHVSEDTVKTRFYRARPLLQLALQEERATGGR